MSADHDPAPQPAPRPADDRSVAVTAASPTQGDDSLPPIGVRLLAAAPSGAERGLLRTVAAIDTPDAALPTTFRVTLAARTGLRARLGLAPTLPLLVRLPAGAALPLQVGDEVVVRVLQAVAGIHPRTGAEVRLRGRTVLLEGDDAFLDDLGDVQVTRGPCTDPGSSRDGSAPRQRGLVRVATQGVAGYSDQRRQLRALQMPGERLLFVGSWTGYGPGRLLPDSSPQIWAALARLPQPPSP